MSFLDKLKVKVEEKDITSEEVKIAEDQHRDKMAMSFLQLEVDILQTAAEIIVVAPIPGVEVKDLDISIENENDVVTIQGKREMPSIDLKTEEAGEEDKKFLRQECQWGPFYRQIILPQEINVAEVKAKFRSGILILRLPLLRLHSKGKKKIIVEG
ncbi:MAG: Hsp20/alpha crystallin family protein [Planctomycetes bacterium]|jgi:HSP20 family protein|nr:Hsp20/alpha crystallin family protein [Planctomycetota bacterium]